MNKQTEIIPSINEESPNRKYTSQTGNKLIQVVLNIEILYTLLYDVYGSENMIN